MDNWTGEEGKPLFIAINKINKVKLKINENVLNYLNFEWSNKKSRSGLFKYNEEYPEYTTIQRDLLDLNGPKRYSLNSYSRTKIKEITVFTQIIIISLNYLKNFQTQKLVLSPNFFRSNRTNIFYI